MVKKAAPGRASFGLVAGRVLLRGFLCGVTGQAAQAPEGQSGLGTAWSVLATSVPLGHLAVGCTLSLGTKAAALTIPGPACSVSTAQMPAGVGRCPGDPRVEAPEVCRYLSLCVQSACQAREAGSRGLASAVPAPIAGRLQPLRPVSDCKPLQC